MWEHKYTAAPPNSDNKIASGFRESRQERPETNKNSGLIFIKPLFCKGN
jgi:hypothetical protein